MKNKKTKLYFWASDFSENSGEGKLARIFVTNFNKDKKYKIILNKKQNYYKYFSPLIGVLFCWQKYLNNQKVCYLNYLPLWNFLIFVFLPPNTLFGPITGGANFSKSFSLNYFVRAFLFPIFYKISEFFLNFRSDKIIFSTDLLKEYLSNKIKKKCEFNYTLKNIKLKKKVSKNNDFIIYYRKHQNKLNLFPYKFIKKLILKKYKVIVVGDKLRINFVKNLGYINNKTLNKIQSKSKFTLASNENIYSFFTLECIENNVKIIIDKKHKYKVKDFKKNFLVLNLKNFKNFKKLKL